MAESMKEEYNRKKNITTDNKPELNKMRYRHNNI